MPDLFALTQRTQEILVERHRQWQKRLEDAAAQYRESVGTQREKRAAYEAMRAMMGPEWEAARAQYDQKYGPEEFGRQLGLGISRERRSAAEGGE